MTFGPIPVDAKNVVRDWLDFSAHVVLLKTRSKSLSETTTIEVLDTAPPIVA